MSVDVRVRRSCVLKLRCRDGKDCDVSKHRLFAITMSMSVVWLRLMTALSMPVRRRVLKRAGGLAAAAFAADGRTGLSMSATIRVCLSRVLKLGWRDGKGSGVFTYRLFAITRSMSMLVVALVVMAGLAMRVQAQAVPARIVSTSPSITETLFALGLGDRVVGVSRFCRYPAAVAVLPKVGTFLKPDAEAIAALRPDIVFVHAGPNSAAAQLQTLGIKTATVDRGGLTTVFTTIGQIGAAAGVADRGEHLIADLRAGLDRVKAAVAGRQPRRVLIIVGRRTGTLTDLVAVGPGSYLHDLATLAGGTNVLADAKLEYPRISMETVISLAPDVIVDIGEMGEWPADADQRRQATESLWRQQTLVKAVQTGAVHATTNEAFVVPGPRILDVAQTLALWFHDVRVS